MIWKTLAVGLAVLAAVQPTLAVDEPTWRVPVPMTELVWDEARFAPFSAEVSAVVKERLGAGELGAEEAMVWLALRVHLALHGGDNPRALAAAAAIRERVPVGSGHAYAGLTTRAFAAAREASGEGSDVAGFRVAFAEAFGRELAALPRSAEMRAVLVKQVEKYTAMTADAIRAEVDAFGQEVGDRATCTLMEADRLVRWRHRWADLLPLREVILSALRQAVAERSEAP